MNIVTEDLPLNHHFIGINSTIPFFLIVNNDENTKTYHSPNDYQINVWDMMLKEKFPNSPAWTMQIRYDKDSIVDSTTLVISSYDVDLANNTAGAKQITVIDGGSINAIQTVNTINTLNTVNTLDSVNEIKKILEVEKINNIFGSKLELEIKGKPDLEDERYFNNKINFSGSFKLIFAPATCESDRYSGVIIVPDNDLTKSVEVIKQKVGAPSEYIVHGNFVILDDYFNLKSGLKNKYLLPQHNNDILQLYNKDLNLPMFMNIDSTLYKYIEFTGYIY